MAVVTQIPLRVAVVGTGHRAGCFIRELATSLCEQTALVALCDSNPQRLRHYADKLANDWQYSSTLQTYAAAELETMIRETRPDTVLICTPDHTHADLVCRVLEAGSDVVVEKPLAIDAAGCQRVLRTAKETGRRVRLAFNCRFLPCAVVVKQLLLENSIGEVLSCNLDYRIGVEHGATYFARWHAQKVLSGGLLVHKACHHFDMLNWWLDAVPQTVFAFGRRGFFGAENLHKHAFDAGGKHYLDGDNGSDPFRRVFADSPCHRELYLAGACHDGYRGDRSVWRENELDIEDVMSVNLRYRTGVLATYTLNAFCPTAGFVAVFNGTRGRIELHSSIDAQLPSANESGAPQPDGMLTSERCVVYPLDGPAYDLPIPQELEGGHGGSDPLMMADLFAVTPGADPLAQHAGPFQGAASALIGVAANQSVASGAPVRIDELSPLFPSEAQLSKLK